MNEIHLWSLDLNLLVVLDVLLRERSVSRAAERLGRTQSAVSHALNRLREALGDELLVRDGNHMRPTARAAILADSLPRALDLLHRSLSVPVPFQAAGCERTFRLAAPDFVGGLLPELLSEVGREAPRARVELFPASASALRDVGEGRFDVMVAPPLPGDRGPVHREVVGESEWAVFARRDHPAFRDWSLAAWARWPHLQVRTGTGQPGPVELAAEAAGVRRSVGAVIAQFAVAPAVLARTDLLLTVPRVALDGLVDVHGLGVERIPFAVPPMPLALYWSALLGGEGDVAWFRARVEHVLRSTSTLRPVQPDGSPQEVERTGVVHGPGRHPGRIRTTKPQVLPG